MLSDFEILERLVADKPSCIFVSPLVDPEVQLGPSSLDLRLGTELTVTRSFSASSIDLAKSKQDVRDQIRQYLEIRRGRRDNPFVLHPGEFALANTLEFIRLPRDIAGRLEGRSSIGRLGVQVHATAGFVDPGFEGSLTFELMNSGRLPVKLKPGLRLGQICFFEIAEVQADYMEKRDSKYGARHGAEVSLIDRDPEIG